MLGLVKSWLGLGVVLQLDLQLCHDNLSHILSVDQHLGLGIGLVRFRVARVG